MNFAESRLNFQSWANVDPYFAKSYAEHFAYVNPWSSYWSKARSGLIALSEEVAPARLFSKTEFYNDWLRPQKDAEAAAGLKLLGNSDETVLFVMHFPLELSEEYGGAAAQVLTRVRDNLERSISIARLIQTQTEGAASAAALVERSRCAAFVVEGSRLVREANVLAEDLFSSGKAMLIRHGRCSLVDSGANAQFGAILAALARGSTTDGSNLFLRSSSGAWQVTLTALPAVATFAPAFLFPPRRLVLVLVNELLPKSDVSDLSMLKTLAGLTPAEIAFCQRLALGESVADAAEQLGITVETARTRLKAIFHKTQTSRQGQLMLLLSRLR
ncbi:hypothetical protein D9M72_418840 [compost metagenome]